MGSIHTIRNQLIVFSLVLLLAFLGSSSLFVGFRATMEQQAEAAHLIETQNANLQQLFRGINESLLTEGTPYSVEIATQAIEQFEQQLTRLREIFADSAVGLGHVSAVEAQWQALRGSLDQFLVINGVSANDDELMVSYGRFLNEAQLLLDRGKASSEAFELARQATSEKLVLTLVVSWICVLGLLLSFFYYLFTRVAKPLDQHSQRLLRLSGDQDVLHRWLQREASLAPKEDITPNELTRLHYGLGFMASETLKHLEQRLRVESEMKALNNELELRVAERTQEIGLLLENHRRLLDSVGEGIFGVDMDNRITFINPTACELLGVGQDEALGRHFSDLMTEQDLSGRTISVAQSFVSQVLESGQSITNDHAQFTCADHRVLPVQYIATPLKDGDSSIGAVVVFLDITERLQIEEERSLAASIYNDAHSGFVVTDAKGRIISVNKAFERITGYAAEEVMGKGTSLLRSGRHPQEFYRLIDEAIQREGVWSGELWSRRKNGDEFPEVRTVTAITNTAGELVRYVTEFGDISDKKFSEQQIYRLANFDALTDLPNRQFLQNMFKQHEQKASWKKQTLAMLSIHIDGIKSVNETSGSEAGDKVIREAAHRIQTLVSASDTVARVASNEFSVLLPDLDDVAQAHQLASQILKFIGQPFEAGGKSFLITASMGLASHPAHSSKFHELTQFSESAMHEAKLRGGNQLVDFRPELIEFARDRLEIEIALREAVKSFEGLELFYQPKLDLRTGRVSGAEALIRWNHKTLGFIGPDRFIPLAEQTELIIPLGKWIFERACLDLKKLLDEGVDIPSLSINLSAVQFQDDRLISTLSEIIESTGVDPKLIDVELTESSVMGDPDRGIQVLNGLKSIGMSISIDDFGVAYSSLSYLSKLPADRLKIDRSFIIDIAEKPEDQAITNSIIEMGHNLNLTVLAEGGETQEQIDMLCRLGCDELQGFWFSRPLPFEKFKPFIQSHRPLSICPPELV